MQGLSGKAILVTGGNSGIGLATATRLIAEGARVMVHGLHQADAEAAAKALGPNCAAVSGQLTDETVPQKLVDATVKAFGRIDGLANNAGISPRGVLGETTAELFANTFAINTRAPLMCADAAIKAFCAQKSPGVILNIGSINALCGQADLTVYSMSKGALVTMTRNHADALGPEGIRVNQLNVGWTFSANEDVIQQREGRKPGWEKELPKLFAPRGTLVQPHEVAAHVAFWLSDDSAPASGQIYELEQYPMVGRNRMQMV